MIREAVAEVSARLSDVGFDEPWFAGLGDLGASELQETIQHE